MAGWATFAMYKCKCKKKTLRSLYYNLLHQELLGTPAFTVDQEFWCELIKKPSSGLTFHTEAESGVRANGLIWVYATLFIWQPRFSLQNRSNFLRILGEQRRKRGKRSLGFLLCSPKIRKKLRLFCRLTTFRQASKSIHRTIYFTSLTIFLKLTPVLHASASLLIMNFRV